MGSLKNRLITTANGVLTDVCAEFSLQPIQHNYWCLLVVLFKQSGTAYTVDALTPQNIKFTEAPATGIGIFIIWLGKQTTGPTFSVWDAYW